MSTEETTAKAQPAATKKAKASKKPAKSKKVATPKKTAKATKAKGAAKPGSKAAIVLDLMRRKEGATLAEIAKATGWQNHSIRGFVSGHVIKKLGLKVESTEKRGRGEDIPDRKLTWHTRPFREPPRKRGGSCRSGTVSSTLRRARETSEGCRQLPPFLATSALPVKTQSRTSFSEILLSSLYGDWILGPTEDGVALSHRCPFRRRSG